MDKILVIPSVYKSFKVTVIGKPPGLIIKRFGVKAQEALEGIEDNIKKKREVRDEKWKKEICEDSLHKHNGGFGIPSTAFKESMKRIMKQRGIPLVDSNVWFFVVGEYCPITKHNGWQIRCDHGKLPKGGHVLIYRPWFPEWEAEITFEYDDTMISQGALLSVLEDAGRLGVLEWRPSSKKPGPFGTYSIKPSK